ncbi:MAG TPA: alkaline phosphatase [Marinobacter sp.]|nr:alkaline phosphatase [Marinobacter sp.]
MPSITRRDFLKVSALTIGAVAVSTGLTGCKLTDDRAVSFTHGVASGDPLQDAVIIWTRAVPATDPATPVTVRWEVATDAEFTNLTHDGEIKTSSDHDFTVKVDVRRLTPGQTYYYRFTAGNETSAAGRTRTLPEGDVSQVKLAVMSCSNYPAGLFHVYREAAGIDDLNAVVHLGDYIYEYDGNGYATQDAEALGRTLPPENDVEIIDLVDYRRRYALYRTDTHLQTLHAAAPFIAVWDDHEITNDTWREGAENHNEGEGDFTTRKLNALQAYFEWMPIRPVIEGNEEMIYRTFRFGDLVSLHMLDTRVIGRDKQLDLNSYFTGSGFNTAAFEADLTDPNRTLLGAEQRAWLQNSLAQSNATWDVLGQQVLMGRMNLPYELLLNLGSDSVAGLFAELATLKARYLQGDSTLTDQEIARVTTTLPYNLDAWDGYFYERETILETARAQDRNLVVLAGDTHNAWASNLTTLDGTAVGVELATPSVTSPGLESYLQLNEAQTPDAEQALTILVDGLDYTNLSQRGFLVVTFRPEAVEADWRYVSTVKSETYSVDMARSARRRTLPGASNRTLQPLT